MKIKVCGLSRIQDIVAVNQSSPDYIGFVFAKSKRQVTKEQAKELKQKLNSDIKVVGVFVNEKIDKIISLIKEGIIDMIQLHGTEDDNYIIELKKYISCPIIKAIKVKGKDDFNDLTMLADFYLLDGVTPGSGETFDWKLIQKLDKPFFLAGGINLTNIDEAMKVDCFGIDISSGVETGGKKDPLKIETIVRRVKDERR